MDENSTCRYGRHIWIATTTPLAGARCLCGEFKWPYLSQEAEELVELIRKFLSRKASYLDLRSKVAEYDGRKKITS